VDSYLGSRGKRHVVQKDTGTCKRKFTLASSAPSISPKEGQGSQDLRKLGGDKAWNEKNSKTGGESCKNIVRQAIGEVHRWGGRGLVKTAKLATLIRG